MKVLCPIDFSSASMTACGWAARMLEDLGGGELVLLHCINVVSRSAMFIKLDDVFKEQAEDDFKALLPKLKAVAPSVKFTAKIANQDPKIFILSFLKGKDFDLIVTGTKGLSALKEMTVGSTTAFLMDRTPVPLVAVPHEYPYSGLKTFVIGLDEEASHIGSLEPVLTLVRKTKGEIIFVNTTEDIDEISVGQQAIDLDGIPNRALSIPVKESIPKSLANFCVENNGDLLVMIHERRPWLERLFKTSLTKEELFDIQTPLFILPAQKRPIHERTRNSGLH
ncbi:MAG: universal stress protein, partial [Bacteroidota bacterium]